MSRGRCKNCKAPVGLGTLFCIDCVRAFTLGAMSGLGGTFLALVGGWLAARF